MVEDRSGEEKHLHLVESTAGEHIACIEALGSERSLDRGHHKAAQCARNDDDERHERSLPGTERGQPEEGGTHDKCADAADQNALIGLVRIAECRLTFPDGACHDLEEIGEVQYQQVKEHQKQAA